MESIMMSMGVIIFLVLLFLLVWQVMKQRPYALLLLAFLIPIVLVGYPAIQSIGFDNWKITITKYAQKVADNPKDTVASNQLKRELGSFQSDSRVQNNPEALAAVATAQLALGKLDSANVTIQKAKALAPESVSVKATAIAVTKQIKLNEQFLKDVNLLDKHVDKLQQQPKDTATTTSVIKTLSNLTIPRYVDRPSALIIARSYATIHQPEQAKRVLNNVVADTGSVEAKELKKELKNDGIKAKAVVLTSTQENTIKRKLRYAPVVGDKAAIK